MQRRRRVKQTESLKDRLASFAERLKAKLPSFAQVPNRTLCLKESGRQTPLPHRRRDQFTGPTAAEVRPSSFV